MGRLLSLVIGLAVVAFAVYYAMTHVAGTQADPQGRSQPKAFLDNTRSTAKQIEDDAEKRVQETLKRSDESR
jgi:hypothetical protein